MSILYGVQRIFVQAIDETTSLPATDGLSFALHCSEELQYEPVMEDAVETVKRCPSTNAIMGDRRIPESLYGYTITLTENEWNIDLHAFLNGMERIPGGSVTPSTAAATYPIAEGQIFPPFRLVAFTAIYEGAEVIAYAVWVFNKCTGSVSSVDVSDDFAQLEYTIHVREATAAGLPLHSIGVYNSSTPPDSISDITIESGIVVQPDSQARTATINIGRDTNIIQPNGMAKPTIATVKENKEK